MNRIALSLLTLALLLAPIQSFAGENIQSEGKFGIGLGLGYPTNGVSANYFLKQNMSIQSNLGIWGMGSGWFGVGIRGDFLFWPGQIASLSWADVTWYVGPGLNLFYFSWTGGGSNSAYVGVGIEAPVGIGFQFKKIPLDLFAEFVPVLHIVGSVGVGAGFGVAGTLNSRYYF